MLLDPAQGGGAADLVQRLNPEDPLRPGLAALADGDHAEAARLGPVEQVPDEPPVPVLEDMQRQEHAGIEHRAEREQRQHLAHGPDPTPPRSLRQEDDLAENMAFGESAVGLPDLAERVGRGHRHLQLGRRDQPCELGEHARAGPGRAALGLDPVPRDGPEVGDCVDARRLTTLPSPVPPIS